MIRGLFLPFNNFNEFNGLTKLLFKYLKKIVVLNENIQVSFHNSNHSYCN